MSELSKILDKEIRSDAKVVAVIVWESRNTFWPGSKLSIFYLVPRAELQQKKICGLLVLIATLSRDRKLMVLIQQQREHSSFLTPGSKFGKIILNLVRIKRPLPEKRCAGEQP